MNRNTIRLKPEMPVIKDWYYEFRPCHDKAQTDEEKSKYQVYLVICGYVTGHKKFPDNSFIRTASITRMMEQDKKLYIQTCLNEVYELGIHDSSLELARPNIRQKIIPMFNELRVEDMPDVDVIETHITIPD